MLFYILENIAKQKAIIKFESNDLECKNLNEIWLGLPVNTNAIEDEVNYKKLKN